MSDAIMSAHVNFGALATLAAVWVFVEVLNASELNRRRIWCASVVVAVFLVLTWAFAGYWYTNFYGADKQVILKGPFPWAHTFVMETKEHLFFVSLILALYLPILTRLDLAGSSGGRKMALIVTAVIVLNGLIMENAGGLISFGAKMAYIGQAGG